MPQMMPIYWFILLLFISILFLMISSITYSFLLVSLNSNVKLELTKKVYINNDL